MVRRKTPSGDRSKVQIAEQRGIATVDPTSGAPIGDYLVDPNAIGEGEDDKFLDDEENRDEEPQEPAAVSPQAIKIHVNPTEPDWKEQLAAAIDAAKAALGVPERPPGTKMQLLKGNPEILKGMDFEDARTE